MRDLAIRGEKHTWQKNSKCKGPGSGACPKGLSNGKGTSVAGAHGTGMGNF